MQHDNETNKKNLRLLYISVLGEVILANLTSVYAVVQLQP